MGAGSRGVRTVAIGLVLLVAVAGCSSDDDDEDRPSTTTSTSSTSSTTTTSTTSTTAPPSTTTTTEAFPSDPQEYTAELVRAWGVGDRAAAERFAAAPVVAELFGFADPGGPRWDSQGCEGAAGTAYCTYRDPQRAMVLHLGIPMANGNTIDGPQEVVSATFGPG